MAKRMLDMVLEGRGVGFDPATMAVVESAVPILADEVCQYFYQESDQEYWNEVEEFQNVAPPYDAMWIEFKAPNFIRSRELGTQTWLPELWQQGACLLVYEDADKSELRRYWPEARWIGVAMCSVFLTDPAHDPHGEIGILNRPWGIWSWNFGVAEDGRLLFSTEDPNVSRRRPGASGDRSWALSGPTRVLEAMFPNLTQADMSDLGDLTLGIFRVALLSVFFMHAKGAKLKEKRVPERLRRARRRRGKASADVTFKVLDIGMPMKRTLEETKREGGDLQRALRRHLRRGGFATYRPEKPHVSGFVGAMWRRPTIVGEGPGRVEKAYRVKPGEKRKKKRKRRRNPVPRDVRIRELERAVAEGDMSALEPLVQERVRSGLMGPRAALFFEARAQGSFGPPRYEEYYWERFIDALRLLGYFGDRDARAILKTMGTHRGARGRPRIPWDTKLLTTKGAFGLCGPIALQVGILALNTVLPIWNAVENKRTDEYVPLTEDEEAYPGTVSMDLEGYLESYLGDPHWEGLGLGPPRAHARCTGMWGPTVRGENFWSRHERGLDARGRQLLADLGFEEHWEGDWTDVYLPGPIIHRQPHYWVAATAHALVLTGTDLSIQEKSLLAIKRATEALTYQIMIDTGQQTTAFGALQRTERVARTRLKESIRCGLVPFMTDGIVPP